MNDKRKSLLKKEIKKLMALCTLVDQIEVIESLGKELRKKNSAESEEEVAQFAERMTGKRIIDY